MAFSKTAIDGPYTLSYGFRPKFRAVSSAVEHYTDTVGVGSSNLPSRTIFICYPQYYLGMATYLYETIPSKPDEHPETFEIQQSMKDAALTHHPENGKPVRRVITGGFGYAAKAGAVQSPRPASGGGCGSGCGCH